MDGYPINTIKAKDIMTRDVVLLNEKLDLHECEKLLLGRGISGAPVVDDEGNLLGVLSKTDLVNHHFESGEEEGGGEDSLMIEGVAGTHIFEHNTPRALDLMSPLPCTAPESCSLGALAALMVHRHVHRIVITRNWKVVGIVSTMDILRALATPPVSKSMFYGSISEKSRPKSSHTSAA